MQTGWPPAFMVFDNGVIFRRKKNNIDLYIYIYIHG